MKTFGQCVAYRPVFNRSVELCILRICLFCIRACFDLVCLSAPRNIMGGQEQDSELQFQYSAETAVPVDKNLEFSVQIEPEWK